MGKALINLYCASYARVPKRIVLDFVTGAKVRAFRL
jgi:hypothetical protein